MIYYKVTLVMCGTFLSLVHVCVCVCVWMKYRLDQCCNLTELLKRFQSIRGELRGTLQRAESTINEQASYMGRNNLQRLHTQV